MLTETELLVTDKLSELLLTDTELDERLSELLDTDSDSLDCDSLDFVTL